MLTFPWHNNHNHLVFYFLIIFAAAPRSPHHFITINLFASRGIEEHIQNNYYHTHNACVVGNWKWVRMRNFPHIFRLSYRNSALHLSGRCTARPNTKRTKLEMIMVKYVYNLWNARMNSMLRRRHIRIQMQSIKCVSWPYRLRSLGQVHIGLLHGHYPCLANALWEFFPLSRKSSHGIGVNVIGHRRWLCLIIQDAFDESMQMLLELFIILESNCRLF